MNETLYYEPSFEGLEDPIMIDLDNQIPEYINPEWNDDVLYTLICENQNVLVEVDGVTMTLSSAMNQHPGPWIPENEGNLIAFAEMLLAKKVEELVVTEEQLSVEIETEAFIEIVETPKAETELVQVEPRLEEPTFIQSKAALDHHIEPTTAVQLKVVPVRDVKIASRMPRKIDLVTTPTKNTRPEHPEVSVEPVAEKIFPTEPNEVKSRDVQLQVNAVMAINEEPLQEVENLVEESDTHMAVNLVEPAADLPVHAPVEESESVVTELFIEISHEANEENSEDGYELPVIDKVEDIFDLEVIEEAEPVEHQSSPDILDTEYTELLQPDQLETIDTIAEEVENTFAQLIAQIELNEPDANEEVASILSEIIAPKVDIPRESKKDLEIVYEKLFAAAGITCTPELVETLASLTLQSNLTDVVESSEDTDLEISRTDERIRALVKKLLVAVTHIIQTIRHVFAIGNYVLRLHALPTADYR